MKLLCVVILMFLPIFAKADEVLVAVASNFTLPMEKIMAEFQKETGHKVSASYGSTGKFYTQIVNGAPFEILLAADEEHPDKLMSAGFAEAQSDFVYAIGKLALWSPKEGFIDSQGKVLSSAGFRHLSMASPQMAPYGAAAEQVLKKMELWKKLQDKIIYGENISQAHQFIASGNAELGFVSLSQVKEAKGSIWVVSRDNYKPLKQKAALLKAGKDKKTAQLFLKFIRTEKARRLIQEFGYEVE